MISTLTLCAVGFARASSTDAYLASAAQVEWLRPAHTLSFQIDLKQGKRARRATWSVAKSGTAVWLRGLNPTQNGLEHSDRRYEITGQKLTVYDALLDERVERKLKGNTLQMRILEALGEPVEPVTLTLDPLSKRAFFATYQHGGFKLKQTGDKVVINGRIGPASVELEFRRADRTLLKLALHKGTDSLIWQVVSGGEFSLMMPANSRRVNSLAALPTLPTAQDPQTKEVLWRLVRGLRSMANVEMAVKEDEGVTRLAWRGSDYFQDGPKFAFGFDKGQLWMYNKGTGKFCLGSARRSQLLDYVSQFGGRIHPYLRAILLRRPPLLASLTADLKARARGTMSIRGEEALVLNCDGQGRRVSFLVRARDGYPLSVTEDTLDRSGHRVASVTQVISYEPWSVQVPLNLKADPLPKIAPSFPFSTRLN